MFHVKIKITSYSNGKTHERFDFNSLIFRGFFCDERITES